MIIGQKLKIKPFKGNRYWRC